MQKSRYYSILTASQVPVLEGALDCWVFLGCLEVLHRIENCCDRAQLDANSSHTVGLWAYATDKVTRRDALGQWPSWNRAFPPLPSCMRGLPSLKPWPLISPCCPCAQLKSLGQLCGLVSRTGPTSEDLNRTVDLLAGLGDERPETGRCSSAPWGGVNRTARGSQAAGSGSSSRTQSLRVRLSFQETEERGPLCDVSQLDLKSLELVAVF